MEKAVRILSITAAIAVLTFCGWLGWMILQAWIGWGLWAIGAGILGFALIVVGILYLISRGESNSWNEGQLALQKLYMANPPKLGRPTTLHPVATTGPVLEPNDHQIAPTLGDWDVRKLEDSPYYVVLPIENGKEIWSAALRDRDGEAILFNDDYDGQIQAQNAAQELRAGAAETPDPPDPVSPRRSW